MKKISNFQAPFRERPAGARSQAAEMNRLWSFVRRYGVSPALTDRMKRAAYAVNKGGTAGTSGPLRDTEGVGFFNR